MKILNFLFFFTIYFSTGIHYMHILHRVMLIDVLFPMIQPNIEVYQVMMEPLFGDQVEMIRIDLY